MTSEELTVPPRPRKVPVPLHVEKVYVGGGRIPLWLFRAQGVERGQLVICQHGLFGSKESMMELCLILAGEGYIAASMDAVNHGERFDPALMVNIMREAPSRLPRILLGTAADLRLAVTDLLSRPEVTGPPVGVAGVSMGGFTALLAAMEDPRMEVVASALAGGNFQALASQSLIPRLMGLDINLQQAGEQVVQLIHRYDPYHNPQRLAGKAVLLVYATGDPIVPRVAPESLHQKLKPLYKDRPERLRLAPHKLDLHALTPDMLDDMASWFRRFLPPNKHPAPASTRADGRNL